MTEPTKKPPPIATDIRTKGPFVARGPVDGDGGGGDDGGMDAKLTELQMAIVRIDGRFDRMGDRLDQIATSMSNFKWQLLAAVIAVALAVIGTSFAIQQMTVATFQAAAQANDKPATSQPIIINNIPAAPAMAASKP